MAKLFLRKGRRVLALSLLCLAFSGDAIFAKVRFEDFTPSQEQWFWEKLDELASFEAFFRVCGQNTDFEQQMLAAAQPCATDAAIQRVRAVFRRRVAIHTAKNPPGICQKAAASGLAEKLKEALQSAIRDVVTACRSCKIC